MRTALLCILFVVVGACSKPREVGRAPITIGTPKRDNLQYLTFWVATGAGLFAKHGVAVELVRGTPEMPASARLERGEVDAAVLPPPRYLDLISRRTPVVLVANLLANDGIALVVQRHVAERLGLSRALPLGERLRKLHGLRIGVASGPPSRLRALFASQGLDLDKEVTIVTLKGEPQNIEFGAGRIDALYCHSPYLETALLEQRAVIVVNQQAGDVPELADRQIQALVVSRKLRDTRSDDVAKLVAAIAEAQRLIHERPDQAVVAILRAFPDMNRAHVAKLVEIYAPAVPKTPAVSAAGFAKALALHPAHHTAPKLDADLRDYVDNRFAAAGN
ncbi:MAG: ABC transporter substrate-binding protein [Kofleriaceae bacterium]